MTAEGVAAQRFDRRHQRAPRNQSSPVKGSRRNRVRATSEVVSAAVKKDILLRRAFTTQLFVKNAVNLGILNGM